MKRQIPVLIYLFLGLWWNISPGQSQDVGNLTIPEYFSLRDSSFLSPVRSQPTGGCWASSALITVESYWRKTGLGDYVFSDKNLQLFHGFSESRNTYGNHYMATAYFSRWSGPVPKSEKSDTTQSLSFDIPFHLMEARYLPDDPDLVRQSLMTYGPVYAMLHFRKENLDSLSNIYYSSNAKINHAVVLCGWNDTLKTEKGRGVWIAQNSLGNNFADSGFFYIPYPNKNILEYTAIWPKWEKNIMDSKLYYYDTLGSFNSYGFGDSVCYGLVKYTAEQAGELTQVASFINTPNSSLLISVYGAFDEETKVLKSKLGNTAKKYIEDAGYYTLDLQKEIYLEQGQDFYLMAQYITPDDTIPLPVESFIPDYSNPHIQSGKCWVNPDCEKWPTTWYACGANAKYSSLKFDLNIRAIVERKRK